MYPGYPGTPARLGRNSYAYVLACAIRILGGRGVPMIQLGKPPVCCLWNSLGKVQSREGGAHSSFLQFGVLCKAPGLLKVLWIFTVVPSVVADATGIAWLSRFGFIYLVNKQSRLGKWDRAYRAGLGNYYPMCETPHVVLFCYDSKEHRQGTRTNMKLATLLLFSRHKSLFSPTCTSGASLGRNTKTL